MGWTSCLPAICMSKTSIHISHRSYRAFEENPLAVENIQSASAFEFCGYKNEKSEYRISSFMCDYCGYSSESKSSLFEHFIKNHVFLCTLCSYAGVSRSSVLKHCFENHEKVLKEKLDDSKLYKLNMGKLLAELDVSSKEFEYLYPSSSLNASYANSDGSSDEELSKSSFLSRSSWKTSYLSQSSDEACEGDLEKYQLKKKMKKFKSRSSHGARGSKAKSSVLSGEKEDSDLYRAKDMENMVHFLDETNSPQKSPHDEEDYNEFSDSSPMDLFFSTEGNENDPDLSESIFHDHKEMFMVSRLPFPIRQDDSPNDPFNEPVSQPETPSILQSILQKDKLDHANTSCASSASKTLADIDKSLSASASLSIPTTSETLPKQLEAAVSQPSAVTDKDSRTQEAADERATQPEQLLSRSGEVMDVDNLPSCVPEEPVLTTKLNPEGNNMLEHFLLPPSCDEENKAVEEICHKEETSLKEDKSENDGKFALLRNLLKEKTETGNYDSAGKSTSLENKTQATKAVMNPSDMSLMELLSTDVPFPLTKSTRVIESNADGNPPVHSITFECDSCKILFTNRSKFERHVNFCKEGYCPPSSVPQTKSLIQGLRGMPVRKNHSLLSHSIQSSLRTDHFTSSTRLSKFSNNRVGFSLDPKDLPSGAGLSVKFNEKLNGEHKEPLPRPAQKLRKNKVQNYISLKLHSKHRNGSWDQAVGTGVVANEGSVLRRMKRKAEQDKEYYPESESSESSGDESLDSFKHRKKSKRVKRHLISSLQKPRAAKVSSAVSLMSKLCEKVLDDGVTDTSPQQSKVSSLLSSSLSSSQPSSFSSSSSSLLSVSQPPIGRQYLCEKETETLLSSSSQLSQVKNKNVNKRNEVGITKSPTKTEPVECDDQKECDDPQKSHVAYLNSNDTDPLASGQNIQDPSKTLLHHLLIMPTKSISNQIKQRSSKSCQSISVLRFDNPAVPNCPETERQSISRTLFENLPNVLMTNNKERKDSLHDGSRFAVSVPNLKQQNSSKLDSDLPKINASANFGKIPRNRSQSLTEGYVCVRDSREIRQTYYTSRLSASMMDIPDPPSVTAPSLRDILKPTSLPLFLQPISPPPPSQSLEPQDVAISEPKAPSVKQRKERSTSVEILSSTKVSDIDSSGASSMTGVSKASTSASTAPTHGAQPSFSSLLRNLLIQHSRTDGNSQ